MENHVVLEGELPKESEPLDLLLPVSECFYSCEGEGPFIGRPMIFVRVFGCNFTCSGFSNEGQGPVKLADLSDNATIDEVPTDRGCDSIYAWHPKLAHTARHLTTAQLEDEIVQLLKHRGMDEFEDGYFKNVWICFTGGEPMLYQKQIAALVDSLWSLCETRSYAPHILFETNASIPVRKELRDSLNSYLEDLDDEFVTFSLSVKLKNSGEKYGKAVRPKALQTYSQFDCYYKFVSDGSEESLNEVQAVLDDVENSAEYIPTTDVWLMAEGATREQQDAMAAKVATAALSRGWSFSPRAHVYLWGNTVGT